MDGGAADWVDCLLGKRVGGALLVEVSRNPETLALRHVLSNDSVREGAHVLHEDIEHIVIRLSTKEDISNEKLGDSGS